MLDTVNRTASPSEVSGLVAQCRPIAEPDYHYAADIRARATRHNGQMNEEKTKWVRPALGESRTKVCASGSRVNMSGRTYGARVHNE